MSRLKVREKRLEGTGPTYVEKCEDEVNVGSGEIPNELGDSWFSPK